MSETDSNSQQSSFSANEADHLPKRPSSGGCVLKAVLMLALAAVGLYLTQSMMVPDVVDDKTVTIEKDVRQTDEPEDSSATETPQPAESQLPKRLTETITMEKVESAEHPLDPLMDVADRSLEIIDSKYADYCAKVLSQVRTGGTLHEENLMSLKVRHAREIEIAGEKTEIPFSIYTRFLKPKSKVGQEAIWVDGRDDGLILGHGTGLLNIKTVRLDPTGSFAMSGNRYPIYQIGFRNLITKMKEFGENDRKYGECEVQIDRGVIVDGRPCTLLTITHPVKRDHFDYHIAKIYIDDQYEIPTGYEGFLWPENKGDEPPLLEKYFYLELRLNCDLDEVDFDTANPQYDYPAW